LCRQDPAGREIGRSAGAVADPVRAGGKPEGREEPRPDRAAIAARPRRRGHRMRLTEEQRLLRDTAREFARNELMPHAAEWDREARFPAEALAELGRLGFMGMLVPPQYGGASADHV